MQASRLVVAAIAAALCALGQGISSPTAAQPGDNARARAEALAEAASKEFTAVMERQRLAQAPAPKSDASPTGQKAGEADDVLGWLRRSSREFQTLMRMLAGERQAPEAWDPVTEAEKKASSLPPMKILSGWPLGDCNMTL